MLLIFAWVGLILIGVGVWIGIDIATMLRTHERAEAVVVSSQRNGPAARFNSDGVSVRYPRVDGRWITASASRSWESFAPGERVPIYYRPETGYRVELGTFFTLWLAPAICAVGALGFLGGAVRDGLRWRRDVRGPGLARVR
jgi:hypothetical protein